METRGDGRCLVAEKRAICISIRPLVREIDLSGHGEWPGMRSGGIDIVLAFLACLHRVAPLDQCVCETKGIRNMAIHNHNHKERYH